MIIKYCPQTDYFCSSYRLLNFSFVFLPLLGFLVMGLLSGCRFYFMVAFLSLIQDYFILFAGWFGLPFKLLFLDV
jgi:hypothetical protein